MYIGSGRGEGRPAPPLHTTPGDICVWTVCEATVCCSYFIGLCYQGTDSITKVTTECRQQSDSGAGGEATLTGTARGQRGIRRNQARWQAVGGATPAACHSRSAGCRLRLRLSTLPLLPASGAAAWQRHAVPGVYLALRCSAQPPGGP